MNYSYSVERFGIRCENKDCWKMFMACLVFLIQEDNFLTKGDIIVMMMFFELFVFLTN